MAKKRQSIVSLNLPRGYPGANGLRLARYRKAPELGPQILFFSGGSALKSVSEQLAVYTHNSIHLVTPFDSGGSSAELRKAFSMPAVGDLRARLLSLADDSVTGHPEIAALFSHRFGARKDQDALRERLQALASGKHPLIKAIDEPMRSLIKSYLAEFCHRMPADFNLAGASIGNLILTGGYLIHNRSLDPIAFLFGQLIKTRGVVRTTTDADLQLEVTLENGRKIVGQHRFSGKETAEIDSPIRAIQLSGEADDVDTSDASKVCKETRQLIDSAELLVFPPGSFYSSIIANLLPKGVVKAINKNPAPRVYIPSLGTDLETLGMSLTDQVRVLATQLNGNGRARRSKRPALDFLLFDSQLTSLSSEQIDHLRSAFGVQVIDVDLAPANPDVHRYDDVKLVEALLAFT